MILITWLICLAIFVGSALALVTYFLATPETKSSWQTLINGFKEGLRGSGMAVKNRNYPVDLYVWEVLDESQVSKQCLIRQKWAAMDIIDWMAEGLPGTPESGIDCGENCHCRLVRYDPKKHPHRDPHKLR